MKRYALVLAAVWGWQAMGDPVTWKVERESGDDTKAAADSTGATAFQSIQAAVNKAASGDTILVGPGVYDNVTATDSKTSVNRVWITGKTLTLKSTKGAAETHIVGRWDTSSASTNGCGKAQIRCVCVNSNCGGTVIEGFTLRDGATRLDRTASGVLNEDIPQLGGGLAVYSQKKDVYLVDCVVSNCTAWMGGGMRGGTAVRCSSPATTPTVRRRVCGRRTSTRVWSFGISARVRPAVRSPSTARSPRTLPRHAVAPPPTTASMRVARPRAERYTTTFPRIRPVRSCSLRSPVTTGC